MPYDKALEFEPDYHPVLVEKSFALISLGRYEEAISMCDESLKIKPDKYKAWLYKGRALHNVKRYQEALRKL